MNFNAYVGIGAAHFVAGRIEEAALWQERGLIEKPGATWIYRNLVASYALLGRDAEAQAGLARMLADYPDLTIAKIADALPFRQAAQDLAEGLKKAGMPERSSYQLCVAKCLLTLISATGRGLANGQIGRVSIVRQDRVKGSLPGSGSLDYPSV